MTELVDTHCHLFLMERPAADVVAEAVAAGVTQMVCAGIDPETSERSIELAKEHPEVFASAGVHPHEASRLDAVMKSDIERLAADPNVVAIGETGLDWFRMHSPREDQLANLAWHVGLSNETGKPLIVHVREAWDDVLRVLAATSGGANRVVIHCFSGDESHAAECDARSYTISFAANVTYAKNPDLRAAAKVPGTERLVVETDSPFLPPEGMRGKENVPGNAWAAARALAQQRAEDIETLAARLTSNARAAFDLPDP
ncbi:MAG: TatD family hydrolase [Actinobacteria bacterium]|nr:TatD family hydrolase [Actinomycetota bacterium]